MSIENNIVAKAQNYVEALLTEKLSKDLTYHNYGHTKRVAKAAEEIGKKSDLKEDELEILMLAVWFHDTGFINSYENHEEESQKIAEEFLVAENIPKEKIKKVVTSILATKQDQIPNNEIERLFIR